MTEPCSQQLLDSAEIYEFVTGEIGDGTKNNSESMGKSFANWLGVPADGLGRKEFTSQELRDIRLKASGHSDAMCQQ